MARTERRVLVDQLLEALPDFVSAVTQLNAVIAERMGVVASDLHCLHALHRGGPATASMLASRVGLTPGSVSRMIDRLDTAGCIKRVPDPSDRRRVLIEPTAEGLDRVAAYYAGLTARTHDDIEDFTGAELAGVLRFVTAARDSTTAEVTRLRAHDPQ